jgi:hypothetical protein
MIPSNPFSFLDQSHLNTGPRIKQHFCNNKETRPKPEEGAIKEVDRIFRQYYRPSYNNRREYGNDSPYKLSPLCPDLRLEVGFINNADAPLWSQPG